MMTFGRMLEIWKREDAANAVDRLAIAAILDPERVRAESQTASVTDLETAHVLACTGADIDPRPFYRDPPATPRGALAALALDGPHRAATLVPDDVPTTPRLDDFAGTVRFLIAAARDRDRNRAFAAWHASLAACAAGLVDPAALFWIARVIVHDLGGEPLSSVARWLHDTIERAAASQERSLREERDRAHSELLDDPVRVAARPDLRLHAWERAARPIGELLACPLEDLGRELSRSVLVDPRQATAAAPAIVARLREGPRGAEGWVDAANALACLGVAVPECVAVPEPIGADAPLIARIRAALVALARGDVDSATAIAGERRGPFVGGLAFTNDVLSLVAYMAAAARARAVAATLDRALHHIGEQLDALCATGQLDEVTVLWLCRVVFVGLDQRALGDVARDAHGWLWQLPRTLEIAREAAGTRTRTFPLGSTLGDGAYRIERWLAGTGAHRLYEGVEVGNGARLLIAFDDHSPKRQSVAELQAAVDYGSPGVFGLAHVGTLDGNIDHWAIVERVGAGAWLPHVIGPADPQTSVRNAIDLGSAVGRILRDGAQRGIVLADVRPELMFAEWRQGRIAVTGLSARAAELFRRHRGELVTHPLFDRSYRAPEPDLDDRSLAFSLAAMVEVWLARCAAPESLQLLLARAASPERERRPSLAELVDALSEKPPRS